MDPDLPGMSIGLNEIQELSSIQTGNATAFGSLVDFDLCLAILDSLFSKKNLSAVYLLCDFLPIMLFFNGVVILFDVSPLRASNLESGSAITC